MPIYEYTCDNCHKPQEILQKINEEAPPICPNCHAKGSLKKIVSASAFHLKGGGWYKDLYSSKKDEKKSNDSPKTNTKKSEDK
jgi:putative FmdB family regulatory protein